jgi:hypothetical protein
MKKPRTWWGGRARLLGSFCGVPVTEGNTVTANYVKAFKFVIKPRASASVGALSAIRLHAVTYAHAVHYVIAAMTMRDRSTIRPHATHAVDASGTDHGIVGLLGGDKLVVIIYHEIDIGREFHGFGEGFQV